MSFGIIGDFSSQPRIFRPIEYFKAREISIDCRWPDMIEIHETAEFGYGVKLLVGTHDPAPGRFGSVSQRHIKIKANAWVASECVLYNCEIGEGAVVAAGSVVRSRIVPPFSVVEGNPARIYKKFNKDTNQWIHIDCELQGMKGATHGH